MHDKFLNYFDETARQGSIRKAAAVLNMSSSSLNRKIISTENRLGIRLFDRHADGVTLTEAGVVVLEHCRKTLFDYQRIVNMVEDIRDMRTGHIDILTLDSITLSLLPEVLHDFQDAYPQVA
ncbi:MAG: LysR family transcriptional regulator, partial [Roseicyclus sp.]